MGATATAKPRPPKAPEVITVYRAMDGAIYHTHCRRRMSYQGTSASGLELEFHCANCHERVMLPETVAAALPPSGGA